MYPRESIKIATNQPPFIDAAEHRGGFSLADGAEGSIIGNGTESGNGARTEPEQDRNRRRIRWKAGCCVLTGYKVT